MNTMRRIVAVFLLGVCAAFSVCAATPPLDLVVMVKASQGATSRRESGAGLIVSQTAARTVVVTALHVVHHDQDYAADISVEFSMLRGKTFPATLSPRYTDETTDVAVLFLDHATVAGVPRLPEISFADAVSPSPPNELVGAKVQVVGSMRGQWTRGPAGDTVVHGEPSRLRVRSAEAQAGASGGGVFDAFNRLVGMSSFLHAETGELVAVPMSIIQQRFQRWGIEYNLGIAGAPTGDKELFRVLERTTRIAIRALPDVHQYSVTVEVPDALARLQPSFRILFPDSLTLQPIELRPPTYSAEVHLPPLNLTTHLWMDTPDGRKTGPMQRLLEVEPLAAARVAAYTDKGSHYEAAMASAAMQNALNWFQRTEDNARRTEARQREILATIEKAEAANFEINLLERLLRDFPKWSMNCGPALSKIERRDIANRVRSGRAIEQPWRCERPSFIGLTPQRGRIDSVIHTMRIGELPARLTVEVPLDHSVADVDAFIKAEVERLLTEGRKGVYAELSLADGRLLGPKALCEVGPHPSSLPLLVCELPGER